MVHEHLESQEVGFRACGFGVPHTSRQSLGITGYAKNLSDGRVEVLACGDEGDLDILIEWLKLGPE